MARIYVATYSGPKVVESNKYWDFVNNSSGLEAGPSKPLPAIINEDFGLGFIVDDQQVVYTQYQNIPNISSTEYMYCEVTIKFSNVEKTALCGYRVRVVNENKSKTVDIMEYGYPFTPLTTYNTIVTIPLCRVDNLPTFNPEGTSVWRFNLPIIGTDANSLLYGYSILLCKEEYEDGTRLYVLTYKNGELDMDPILSNIYGPIKIDTSLMMSNTGLSVFYDDLAAVIVENTSTSTNYVKV